MIIRNRNKCLPIQLRERALLKIALMRECVGKLLSLCLARFIFGCMVLSGDKLGVSRVPTEQNTKTC